MGEARAITAPVVELTGEQLNILRAEAHQGNSEAMMKLAVVSLEGKIRSRDFAQARVWLEMAGGRVPGAWLTLAALHTNGLGGPRNPKKALRLCRAEFQAHPFMASLILARKYRASIDVANARAWYTRALAADGPGLSTHCAEKLEAVAYLNETTPKPPPAADAGPSGLQVSMHPV